MPNEMNGWTREDTGGGVICLTRDGWSIGDADGSDVQEGCPCLVTHYMGNGECVEFQDPAAAREAVEAIVEVRMGIEAVWTRHTLRDWVAANEHESKCVYAAIVLLRAGDATVEITDGAGFEISIRCARKEG